MKKSSHQNRAADNFLATSLAVTATVERTTPTMLPTHTFHAILSLGGKAVAMRNAVISGGMHQHRRMTFEDGSEQNLHDIGFR